MIHQTLLSEQQRIHYPARLFGLDFPLRLEPCVFDMASMLSADYEGGLWHFYALGNGGFYMAPNTPETFRLAAPNGFDGKLSAHAMGITACLYAYSVLSMAAAEADFAQECGQHYHLLRDFTRGHPEEGAILAAID